MTAFIFKTKGALESKLQEKKKSMLTITFTILMTVVITQAILNTFWGIKTYYLISLVWLFSIMIIPHILDMIPFTYLKYAVFSPLLLVLNIVHGIMILMYRNEYPNISQEHADRYRKIKKLMKK